MASLAGVDPTAETGVTGGVENTMLMEPSAEKREATSEKQREIDHTNIPMSMDVLTRQFIYQGTYQWKTSDAPGTVIATFPIHPDSCNMYTSHVYKMFGAYVGGMKARMRIIGTAFYGGGIYMVRVPPYYKPSDIAQFGLAGMTAFPHTDVDPKNLDSVDVLLEDFRSEHFHTGPLNTNDSKSFGGWLALVVNARLVTQTAEIRSLDLRMEFAGDFQFQVPVPIRIGATNATGPLTSLKIRDLTGCDDALSMAGATLLNVVKSSYLKASAGNIFHKSAGGKYTYDEQNSDIINIGQAKWQRIYDLRDSNDNGQLVRSVSDGHVEDTGSYISVRVGDNLYEAANFCADNAFKCGWQYAALAGQNVIAMYKLNEFAPPIADSYEIARFKGDIALQEQSTTGVVPIGTATGAPSFDNTIQIVTPRRNDTAIGDESYVIIGTNWGGSINTQAKAWSDELAAFKEWPTGSAAIYTVLNKNNTVIATLKLRENGHFYAPATATSYTIQGAERLVFKQWLPEKEPLPVVAAQQRMMMNAATQKAVKDAYEAVTTKFQALRLSAAQ